MKYKSLSLIFITCALVWPMASLAQEQTSTSDTQAPLLTLDEAVTLALQHNRLVKNSVLEARKNDSEVSTARSRRKAQFQFSMLGGELLHAFDFTFEGGVFGT
jgi:outer membrane protein TolC